MNILVLHGSPKGKVSVTYQFIRYMIKMHPQHHWDVALIGAQAESFIKDEQKCNKLFDKIKAADFIFWTTPVYFSLIPSQYQKFIEHLFKTNNSHLFHQKQTAILITSIHYYDDIALDYLQIITKDLKMDLRGLISLRSKDLLEEKKRTNFEHFINYVFDNTTPAIDTSRILIIRENSPILDQKIAIIGHLLTTNLNILSLDQLRIAGGCTGCIHCGLKGECIYDGKDDHRKIIEQMLNFDIIIFAIENPYHVFSPIWKSFLDRTFAANHIPIFKNKILSFVTSMPAEDILHRSLNIYLEFEFSIMGGIAHTDEEIKNLIDNIKRLNHHKYIPPQTFLGIGGRKIIRDEIWSNLRVFYNADHRYFKKEGYYDFPKYKTRTRDFILLLMLKFPRLKKLFQRKLKEIMISPYQKLFKDEKGK